QGIKRKLPHLGDAGKGINRQLPHLGDAGQCEQWSTHLREMMRALSDRLRRVRVCSGDWSRVVGPSVTTRLGITGVFLDPPYSDEVRYGDLYAADDGSVAAEVRAWAIAHGDDPQMRIALCGFDHEHGDYMPPNWTAVRWARHGGYGTHGSGRGRANRVREVIWFSPHCLPVEQQAELPLYEEDGAA